MELECVRESRLVLTIFCTLLITAKCQGQANLTIGAVLENMEHLNYFHEAVGRLTAPSGYRYNSVGLVIGNNPITSALEICDEILPKKVFSVLFQMPKGAERYMTAVPFTLEFYKIPVIGISSRSSVLSNSYSHPLFMRTQPPYSFEAYLWMKTLKKLKYNKVIFIYTNDVEGEATLNEFRNAMLKDEADYGEQSLEIERLVMLEPYETDFTENLRVILSEDSRVILLAVDAHHASNVYNAATSLGLFDPGWVWIVYSEATFVRNLPPGILSWKISANRTSPEDHIDDALTVIQNGINKYLSTDGDLGTVPNSCDFAVKKDPDDLFFWQKNSAWWQPGLDLFALYKQISLRDANTGILKFAGESGNRVSIDYNLINFQNSQEAVVGIYRDFINQSTNMMDNSTDIDVDRIVWPSEIMEKPLGFNRSNHLRVVTISEIPFVYTEPYYKDCNASQDASQESSENVKMRCPRLAGNGTVYEYCCYGYLIDMIDKMSTDMNVTFEIHLVSDGKYGNQNLLPNSTNKIQWTGLMGELLSGKADMIVAPFAINPERAKYVDFTKPYKFLGKTILVKKSTKESNLGSFLQPFQLALWFLVVVSVFIIALVLYLLDRFSPFGQLQLAREANSEDALTLSTAIWFAWGVLLNSGIGEGTPKSFSARVLGMVWAGFAMIIVASYTANLAAFLVLDKPEASISGIDDPRLRNPTEGFSFATVKDSSVEQYFKRQVEFTTMFRTMEVENRDTVEEAIEAVENKKLNAFIWDSPRLTYEATKKCELVTAGELFGRSSYGIAFTKNSHWTDQFSLKILSYHEVGQMEKYDNKWIMQKSPSNCEQKDTSPATLGLKNMAGVFMMVGVGIAVGFAILLIEIVYDRYEKMKTKQNTIARKAVARWKRYVQRRRALNTTWALIKDINDSEAITEAEKRSKIREYLSSSHSSLASSASKADSDRMASSTYPQHANSFHLTTMPVSMNGGCKTHDSIGNGKSNSHRSS